VEAIGGRIDALFNCAGLPGGRFSDFDTMLVNFVGQRHLADLVVDAHGPGGPSPASPRERSQLVGQCGEWKPLVTTEDCGR